MNKVYWKQVSDRWANEGLGKEHMDTIDYDAPRDFMDTMLNEANNNDSEIGYHTIAMSIVGISVAFTNRKDGLNPFLTPWSTAAFIRISNQPIKRLYLGGSDTVSNTIRWAFLILTEYPEVQERCYEEILQQTSEEGRENIDSAKCHYTQSVLLECRRLHPVGNRPILWKYFPKTSMPTQKTMLTTLWLVKWTIFKADSLPHQATEDIYFENYYFPAGTTFFGSLFAIMHNPKDFPEPESFKPERFLDSGGKFQNDPKVCSFRIVLQKIFSSMVGTWSRSIIDCNRDCKNACRLYKALERETV